MIRLAIFDLGGVLYALHAERGVAEWAAASGLPPERFAEGFRNDETHDRFETGEMSPQEFYKRFCRRLEVDIPFEVFRRGWCAIYGDPYPQVVAAIQRVKKQCPVVALTNTNEVHCEVWLPKYAAELELFDAVYISNQIGLRKPDRKSYEYVLAQQGVAGQEAVFFDDHPGNVEAARAVGIHGVLVTGPDVIPAELARLGLD
jgi:putative hydrolase of the HAD superfamily